eukprot:ctg_7217.g500
MSNQRYPEEFKIQAVKQVTEKAASCLGGGCTIGCVRAQPLCLRRGSSSTCRAETGHGGARHLKKGRRVLCQGVRLKYAFIKQRAGDYSIRRLCLTLKVHPSGYYAWLSEPQSVRAKEDQRLLGLIKHSWLESGGVYGYRKIHDDLRE